MVFRYCFVLPILIFIWFPATFVITYAISVARKDVPLVFPYISDTGNWSPESCFFGLMLNLGAVLEGSIAYIRYRQVREICEKDNATFSGLRRWNFFGLIMGVISSIGTSVVGNFQELNLLAVHLLGAAGAFGGGSVYQMVQTYLSFRMFPTFGNKKINVARLILTLISCVTVTITAVLGAAAFYKFDGDDITKFSPENKGYIFHFISAITEWILAIATMTFLLLFTGEFKRINISEPLINVVA